MLGWLISICRVLRSPLHSLYSLSLLPAPRPSHRLPHLIRTSTVALLMCTLVGAGVSPSALAQSDPLPTIGVSADTSDAVGAELLSQLRDAIKRAGFYPSTNADRPLVGIHLLSVAPRSNGDAQMTVYSAAWTNRDGRFMTHTVGTCTLKTAADCANSLMVTTSQIAAMQQAREAAAARDGSPNTQ